MLGGSWIDGWYDSGLRAGAIGGGGLICLACDPGVRHFGGVVGGDWARGGLGDGDAAVDVRFDAPIQFKYWIFCTRLGKMRNNDGFLRGFSI